MFNTFKSYLQFGNHFCGIEHSTKNGEERISAILLKKQKDTLDIENTFKVPEISSLASLLPKKQHLHLVVNNDSVLSKNIESPIHEDIKLVYNAFPNINLEAFYFEVFHQGNLHFISICRKEVIDQLVEKYKELGFSIINFSLGNSPISILADFILEETTINTSNAEILFKNGKVLEVDKTNAATIKDNEYTINGLIITSGFILSLSAVLKALIGNNNPQTNFESEKQSLLNEYYQTRFFNLFLKFAGLFLLSVLLINFLFFNHYYTNATALQQNNQVNTTTKQKIISLNDKVTKTQKMVEDVLQSSTSKSSFYAQNIVNSLPSTILLTALDYQPLEKRIKKEKPIEVDKNSVVVSGESNSSASFSKWISTLEQENWVAHIDNIIYSDLSSSKAAFSFKINIKND